MFKDPIVQEIREIRDANAAKFDYNIKAIIEDAQIRQKALNNRVVSFVVRTEKSNNTETKIFKQ